jgi:hypothetical protein
MLYALPHLAPLAGASQVDVGHVATADAFGHTVTATARPIGPCTLFSTSYYLPFRHTARVSEHSWPLGEFHKLILVRSSFSKRVVDAPWTI